MKTISMITPICLYLSLPLDHIPYQFITHHGDHLRNWSESSRRYTQTTIYNFHVFHVYTVAVYFTLKRPNGFCMTTLFSIPLMLIILITRCICILNYQNVYHVVNHAFLHLNGFHSLI